MSRRAAADRFGVAVATLIRWVRAWRCNESVCVKPRGGDLGSHRVEAYRASILAAIDAGGHHTDGAGRYAPRAAWRVVCAQRLAFIDETGASTKMARRDGRARRGPRCRAPIPDGHWQTTTFTGALRLGGMTAPMVLDGPMNGVAERRGISSPCRLGADTYAHAWRHRRDGQFAGT